MIYSRLPVKKIQRLAISRVDNLGDVLFTLPIASLLKQAYPHLKIVFIARRYAHDLLAAHPAVDEYIAWDDLEKSPQELKKYNLDAIIHVLPLRKMAEIAKQAGIRYRVGIVRRLYNFLHCNCWLNFSRKGSLIHEALLNLKLLKPFGLSTQYDLTDLASHVALNPKASLSSEINVQLNNGRFNLVLHPASNGNAREWPLEYYDQLITALPKEKFNIWITGTEKERELLQPLLNKHSEAIDLVGRLTLAELITLLSKSHGIIAASTGPLHIGAALDIHALGLFAPLDPEGPGGVKRWQPLGKKAEHLVISGICHHEKNSRYCDCMRELKVDQVRAVIDRWLKG